MSESRTWTQRGWWDRAGVAALILVWFALVPAWFMVLYATIEIQDASQRAVASEPQLATFTIVALAERIDKLDEDRERFESARPELVRALAVSKAKFQSSDQQLRSTLATFAAENDIPLDAAKCSMPAAEVSDCFNDLAPRGAALARRLKGDAGDQLRARLGELGTLRTQSQAALLDFEMRGNDLMRVDERLAATQADAKAIIADQDKTTAGRGGSVAFTYRWMKHYVPLFPYLYILPTGVIIAFFTGVMGAIGAAVASLLEDMEAQRAAPGQPRSLWNAYVAQPVLGSLAGFTVYFVVSAGAAFLVEPGAGDEGSAVNNLSPPALASLGVFAGLTATQAVRWMREKAASFFKTSEEPPPRHGN